MKNLLFILSIFIFTMFSGGAFAAEDKMMMGEHTYNLENVTGDATIRGIVTSDNALGHAAISYTDEAFTLHAQFEGLTDPEGDDFYEGWLVQKTPFMFISTGELYQKDGNYINHFESGIDYTSYDFYVLTLEPNDGNPAPADHIFEGTVLNHTDMMMKDDHTMMKKGEDKMMDKGEEMMEKEDPKRKLLKMNVVDRISKINLSIEKIDLVLSRINDLEEKLPSLRLSNAKKQQYTEILSVLQEVLLEKKETMMQK